MSVNWSGISTEVGDLVTDFVSGDLLDLIAALDDEAAKDFATAINADIEKQYALLAQGDVEAKANMEHLANQVAALKTMVDIDRHKMLFAIYDTAIGGIKIAVKLIFQGVAG